MLLLRDSREGAFTPGEAEPVNKRALVRLARCCNCAGNDSILSAEFEKKKLMGRCQQNKIETSAQGNRKNRDYLFW